MIFRVGQHLSKNQNDRLRVLVKEHIDKYFSSNRSAFAKRIGRSQPSISTFLSGKDGWSMATANRFARLVGKPVLDLIGPDETDIPLEPHMQELASGMRMAREGNISDAIMRVVVEHEGVEATPGRDRHWWFDRFRDEYHAQLRTMEAQKHAVPALPEAEPPAESARPRRRRKIAGA